MPLVSPDLDMVPMVQLPPRFRVFPLPSVSLVVPVRLQVAVLVRVMFGDVTPEGLSKQVALAGPVAESQVAAVKSA